MKLDIKCVFVYRINRMCCQKKWCLYPFYRH